MTIIRWKCPKCGFNGIGSQGRIICVCDHTFLTEGILPVITIGPGTELTKLIPDVFKHNSCGCEDYAKQMNTWGVKGCEKRFDEIVEHLVNQARKIPLVSNFTPINRCFIKKWVREAIDVSSISVVWVYWEAGAEDEELRYSMRSASTNINGIKNLVLCGDKPDWYLGDFIHSPRVSQQYVSNVFGSPKYLKWCDSIYKLEKIVSDPNVTENFLWLYDDTFIVRSVSIGELSIPCATRTLHNGNLDLPGRSSWREVMRRTARVLTERNLPQRNYSTHYPIIYNKKKLKETLHEFNAHHNPYVIESLYMNHHYSDPVSPQNFEYRMRIPNDWKPKERSTIINVGSFNTHVQSIIKPMFPDPIPQETSWHKSS